jgi:puromycin-sensitive aminopeptidase
VDRYRLPRTVLPSRYELELAPDLAAASFTGTVRISAEASVAVDAIVMNAAELSIAAASVNGSPVSWSLDDELERLTLDVAIGPGSAVINIAFTGTLNDKLRGFYRSTHTTEDGTTEVIATTQMQATDCRRAFPCFDEPDMKAVFSVALVVDPDLAAISNAPETQRTPFGQKVRVQFADTMVMSTYLVAFVVGHLDATDPVDATMPDGSVIPIRVVHVPGKAHLTGFALDVARFSLEWLANYYGIACPAEKMDLIALPDFAAGAMENVGCVTFREVMLLVDPETATQTEEQIVADVVAHELAHMWFGDLVTMRWWNGIWLNEAFATFMELKACDAFRPAWERWTTFGLSRSMAFDVDSLRSTRPIEFEVVSPSDADGMFDVLTYEKGAAVLRMVEQHLGEAGFRDGVRLYLERHAYANTETSDLFDAIEEVTGAPVRELMDSWIWQGGHPLVSASLNDGGISLCQRRFLADGEQDDDSTWLVPTPFGLLGKDPIAVDDTGAAVVVNRGAAGFFRTAYDDALRARISGSALGAMAPIERYQLVDDTWAGVLAGSLGADAFVSFTRAFGDETELPVWRAVLAGLGWCDRVVDGEARERLRHHVRALVAPALHRLGWEPVEGERDLDAELRGLLVQTLGVLGADPSVRDRAAALASSSDAAIAAAGLTVLAANGDAETHARLVDTFRTGVTPQVRMRHLYALADLPGADQRRATLGLIGAQDVKSQDAPYLLARMLANRDQGPAVWTWIAEHWSVLLERFPGNSIVRMVGGVRTLTDEPSVHATQTFFSEHGVPAGEKTLAQTLERQRINAAFRARESPRLLTT